MFFLGWVSTLNQLLSGRRRVCLGYTGNFYHLFLLSLLVKKWGLCSFGESPAISGPQFPHLKLLLMLTCCDSYSVSCKETHRVLCPLAYGRKFSTSQEPYAHQLLRLQVSNCCCLCFIQDGGFWWHFGEEPGQIRYNRKHLDRPGVPLGNTFHPSKGFVN